MKKKIGFISLMVVGLLAFSQGSVGATEVKVMNYAPLKIDNNLTVNKFSDGRLEGVKDAKSLTETQKNVLERNGL